MRRVPVLTNRLEEFRIEHKRTVNGSVYALGSSMVTSICSEPKLTRVKRSNIFPVPVRKLPFTSTRTSSRNPTVAPPGRRARRKLWTHFRQRLAVREDLADVMVAVVRDHDRSVALHNLLLVRQFANRRPPRVTQDDLTTPPPAASASVSARGVICQVVS